MNKIRFAVIGTGHIGKRHAQIILNNPNAELIALCDIKPREELQLGSFDVPFYNDAMEMLSHHPEIDVVNICIPNGLHAEYALKALDLKKHIVIEKPMALTRNDSEKIIFKSLQVSKHVFVVMQNRYSPPSVWLKQIIDEQLLGQIFLVQINCYWNRDERYYKKGNWHGTLHLDGGTLFTQFSHFIDIMYWIFGDIKNIKAHFNSFNHRELTEFEDSGLVTFEFVNGGMGCFNYSTSVWNENLESSITIIGEKGTVKISGQYMNEVVYCNIKDYTMPALSACNPPNDYGAYKGSAANHSFIIDNVVETLNHQSSITTNALEGLKVVDIIERIYSHKQNNSF